MINFIHKIESFLIITHTGYAEHFIGGIIIAAIVSFFVFKKTNMIWVGLFIGIATSSLFGLAKELIDPYMRGDRDKLDLIFTCIGGLIGAVVMLLIQKVKKKEVLNSN